MKAIGGARQAPEAKVSGPLVVLASATFLAPIVGGKVAPDPLPMPPGFGALFGSVAGGGEAPALATAVLGTLTLSAYVWQHAARRVVQLPFPPMAFSSGLLALMATASIAFSSFRLQSVASAAQWILYVLAFLAVVACAGRGRGPVVLLCSLVAGCAVVAALGILEYAQTRAVDPSWRVFSSWTNPNALAGMLLIGFFASLGLLATQERLGRLAVASATLLIAVCLALTQSKGAFVSAGIGFTLFTCFFAAWIRTIRDAWRHGFPVVATCCIALAFVAAVSFRSTSSGAGPTPGGLLARMQNAQATTDQSAGFRRLLWASSLELIRENPVGHGMGTFRYVSTRPGLTPQTQNPHNSLLQLGVEGGIFAALGLMAMGLIWVYEALRGARTMRIEVNLLRAGIVSAIAAAGAHSMVDSDLHYAGSGLAFFIMLGVGMLLSADAVTPEQSPRLARALSIGLAVAVAASLAACALVEVRKSQAAFHLEQRAPARAREALESISWAAAIDGDVSASLAAFAEGEERLALLRDAAQRAPSPRNQRALARELSSRREFSAAEAALRRALTWDPNNLLALKQLRQVQLADGREHSAVETAIRIVAIEAKPYFRVRAIPEIVPTETFEARAFLARNEPSPDAKIRLLDPALQGMSQYLDLTWPMVEKGLKHDPPILPPGERLDLVRTRLQLGASIAESLAESYGAIGRADEAAASLEAARRFAAALASLDSIAR